MMQSMLADSVDVDFDQAGALSVGHGAPNSSITTNKLVVRRTFAFGSHISSPAAAVRWPRSLLLH